MQEPANERITRIVVADDRTGNPQEPQSQGGDQELEQILNDPTAIKDLMVLYDIDEKTARRAWASFSETVRHWRDEARSEQTTPPETATANVLRHTAAPSEERAMYERPSGTEESRGYGDTSDLERL